MGGAPVQQSVTLRHVVDIMEDVAIGMEGEVRLRGQESGIEQQASHEGRGVGLVDDQDVVFDVLSLEEGMHELEEGGQVLLPVPVREHDHHPRAGLALLGLEVTPGSQDSRPGPVLLLQGEVRPGGGEVQGGVPPHHRGGAEWQGIRDY